MRLVRPWFAVPPLFVFITWEILPLQAPLPSRQLRVAGLKDSVEVLRDRWGVPHIYAKSANDLFFAQGYIAAKDRLFQLDMWRRTGRASWHKCSGPLSFRATESPASFAIAAIGTRNGVVTHPMPKKLPSRSRAALTLTSDR
jgi:hypothetical protein